MKYTAKNPPMKCFMRQSTWYKGAGKTTIIGVLIHSTGSNNPNLKRYVQPDDNAPDRKKMLDIIGVNNNHNDWNHIDRQAGVHAFIGKLANGEVTSIQVGEWDKKAWGCGSGKYGSCNNGWIQFECCEADLTDPVYFKQIYNEAVELTAYLCAAYKLNPLGTIVYNGVKVPVILCHQDSYRLGLGGNHSDVLHWFPKHGKSMDDFRKDVANKMKEDDDEVTYEQWKDFMNQYRKELASMPAGMPDLLADAKSIGLTDGSRPKDLVTREEAAIIARAAYKKSVDKK